MHEHLNTLGVTDKATPEELKKAWLSKCKETHPDKGGDPAKFRKVMHAYKMLTDTSYQHEQKGPDLAEALVLRIRVPARFEDGFFGKVVVISYNRTELEENTLQPVVKEEQEVITLRIHLPAGCLQGHQHLAAGGGLKCGDKVGDCVVVIQPNQHPRFRVSEMDVITEELVPLDMMLKGGELEIQTMWGLRTLRVPPGSQPGQRIKIKRCGVSQVGHHYALVKPIYPSEQDLKEKRSWKDLHIDWSKQEQLKKEEAKDSASEFEDIFAKLQGFKFT